MMTLLQAMDDPQLFARWFQGPSWHAWKVFLKALFALPMNAQEAELYRQCTGRSTLAHVQGQATLLHAKGQAIQNHDSERTGRSTVQHADGQAAANHDQHQVREAWVIAGRRAGKSHVAALLVTYIATFTNFTKLAPGERPICMAIASDRKQARVIFRYIQGLLENVPLLSSMIEGMTKESISLTNGAIIEVHTASYRAIRGYSIACAVLDELAFWDTAVEAASPDQEVIAALKPGMASIPQSLLLCISSPYSRRGALWEAYRRYYGQGSNPTLVWKAPTEVMNPHIDRALIEQAYEQDPARASSEYGAEFRSDIEAFVSQKVIESCIVPGRYELGWIPNTLYKAFCDPSGGSSDSFTLSIAHQEGDRMVLDLVRERKPPFSPDGVVKEFAETLRAYGLYEVYGDRYGGGWPVERFAAHGIAYRTSEKSKSDLYLELLPLLNAGRIELLDTPRLVAQLANLERRTARSGKDSIDHGPGGHDDLINAAAGALTGARLPANFTDDDYDLGVEPTDFIQPSLTGGEPYRGYFE